ncbi:SCO4225 family membrane protein [Streptomyces sp. NPDC056401]|uniref:SCO4225 family membrane protein n=1 Tax=Streptomyces sp. NPDC056401 TaxID=3345809 RepID=UPI0035E1E272
MARRWSKPEMWVPGGYLALVLSMLVYIAIGSRTGDIGIFAALPILATAPVSLLLLSAFIPTPGTSPDDSEPGVFGEFGLYGAVLIGALVNAAAIWALLRHVARRHAARGAQL